METRFKPGQLDDPDLALANDILRKCVHCGFCTATCPSFVIRGDELDSPRGRIYLMREWLEKPDSSPDRMMTHLDRCLGCYACMTTCPSGVGYSHLLDLTRNRAVKVHGRPLMQTLMRRMLALVLPSAGLFRFSVKMGLAFKPLFGLLPKAFKPLAESLPKGLPEAGREQGRVDPDQDRPSETRGRVAMFPGCVQKVLRPAINESTIRLLTRRGWSVDIRGDLACCGSLDQHLGREEAALVRARTMVRGLHGALEEGATHIVLNATGCGRFIRDYPFILRNDPELLPLAEKVAAATVDAAELLSTSDQPASRLDKPVTVALQTPCSMQHGVKGWVQPPRDLLKGAGFTVREPGEPHLCCGSAGTYSLLQPEISEQLKARKLANLKATGAQIVATGNIGCLDHLGAAEAIPVVHIVELLDWAEGGPKPAELENIL